MIIGITGCVGAGKSTLANALGFPVLDVDEVGAISARAIGVHPAMALARIVQGDRALEAQLATMVKAAIDAWLQTVARPCVIDSALLFEQGLDASCTLTVCVTCPVEVRRARVVQRRTASAQLFDQIEAAQWPEAQKAAGAQIVISTEGTVEEAVLKTQSAVFTASQR
ncbi:MAG: dephospho-CoA kinase [Archangium sp.]